MSLMKNIHTLVCCSLLVASALAGCEKDLPINQNPESRMAFVYERMKDTLVTRSFAFYNDDVMFDTVWLDFMLLGVPADHERPIAFRQLPTGQHDAVPGVHYVPFDDPGLAGFYKLPANALSVTVPFVFKRDASLKEDDYRLKITFEANEAFVISIKERATRTILISDQLVKPNRWDGLMDYFFGKYGKEKHRFLAQTFGGKWDDEYLDKEIHANAYSDQVLIMNMVRRAYEALATLNAQRAAAKGAPDPLKEADGTIVEFPEI